jgi:hypothetical protein
MRTSIVSLMALVTLALAPHAQALRQVRVFEDNVSSQAEASV